MTSKVVYVNNEPSTLMEFFFKFFFQSRRKTQPEMNKKIVFPLLDKKATDRTPQGQKSFKIDR